MPVKSILLLLAMLPLMVQAENDQAESVDEQPDLSLLEFLGSFEEQDNVWLDAVIDETQTAQVEINKEVQDHE
ncbi:MAG: hypothetical protein P8Y24_08795 [Gammaproteobacteria bacterium]